MQFSKNAEEAVAWVSHDGLSKLNSMHPARILLTAGDDQDPLVRVAGQVQSTFQATRAWFVDPTVQDEVARASYDAFPSGLPVWELP